ncbi:MAG: hypothetical protein JST89_17985 [Cyanobacteria bacterium SZAS-4]|nr:hypothetical protein [Cyanobacteria bacterium SZAS-4]
MSRPAHGRFEGGGSDSAAQDKHNSLLEQSSFTSVHGEIPRHDVNLRTSHSAAHILKGAGADLTITGTDQESFHHPRRSIRLATGDIAAKYESKNDPSIVNRDPNRKAGHDYGAWQFNSRAKVPQEYVKWAESNDPSTYAALKDHTRSIHRGSRGDFGHAWKEHAAKDPSSFNESQRRFAMDKYLKPLEDRFPRIAQNQALQELAFATAIQSGVGGATRLLRRAGFDREDKSSQELIADLTKVRTRAYKGNARRYASEGQELDELSQKNHAKRIDQNAFSNMV